MMRATPLVALLGMFCGIVASAEESIDTVQKAVADWAKVRSETVRLEADWQTRRQLIDATLQALQERVTYLENTKASLSTRHAGNRDAQVELSARTAETGQAVTAATARLEQAGRRLMQLRPALPPRLSQSLELPFRSLADEKLSTGERVQLMVRVLNRCTQFNRSITFAEEVIDPGAGGNPRMMEVLYWGLSHAYALERTTGKAYLGQSASDWSWQPLEGEFEQVKQLIEIHKDRQDPALVESVAVVATPPAAAK